MLLYFLSISKLVGLFSGVMMTDLPDVAESAGEVDFDGAAEEVGGFVCC